MNVNFTLPKEQLSTDLVDVYNPFNPDDYRFSVDWLNVRVDAPSLEELLKTIFQFVPWLDPNSFIDRDCGGVCFYPYAVYCENCGYSSFTINYALNDDGSYRTESSGPRSVYGFLISLSGDGCRYLNSLHPTAFYCFLSAINCFKCSCSRIDVACDIFDKDNCLVPMIQLFADFAYDRDNAVIDLNCNLNRLYKAANGEMKYRQWVTCNLVYDDFVQDMTRNVTIGGHDCKKGTMQLYNKRVEVSKGRLSDVSQQYFASLPDKASKYWWRLEIRCKSYAQDVFDALCNTRNIYSAFYAAVLGFGSFVVPKYDSSQISKAETAVPWLCFLNFVCKLAETEYFAEFEAEPVQTPYVSNEVERVKRYHKNMISKSDAKNIIIMLLDPCYRSDCIKDFIYYIKEDRSFIPFLEQVRREYGGYAIPDLVESLQNMI